MARRRKTKTRKVYVKSKSRRRRSKGGSSKLINVPAMAYGAVRGTISGWLSSVVPIPVVGNVGDEVVMGLANWLGAKYAPNALKNVFRQGLVVENAMIGSELGNMFLSGGNKQEGTASEGW